MRADPEAVHTLQLKLGQTRVPWTGCVHATWEGGRVPATLDPQTIKSSNPSRWKVCPSTVLLSAYPALAAITVCPTGQLERTVTRHKAQTPECS